jgi:hypothetical protein
VVRRDTDVRRAVLHESAKRVHHATHGRDLLATAVLQRRHRIEVPEQLIGAVDEVNSHAVSIVYAPRLRADDEQLSLLRGREAFSTLFG